MKKIIITISAIVFLLSAGFALARTVELKHWYVTDRISSGFSTYEKTFDEDTNVVCYSYQYGGAVGSISCLKNN